MSDLDALLDETLDTLDTQEKLHAQEMEQKRAREMMNCPDRTEPADAVLLDAVKSLIDVLQKGPDGIANAPESEMLRIQQVLSGALDTMKDGATDDELESINKCRELLQQCNDQGDAAKEPPTDEELKAMQELLAAMNKNTDRDATQSRGELDEETIKRMCQELMDLSSSGQPTPPAAQGSISSQIDSGSTSVEQLLTVLLKPDTIVAPFRAMKQAFPRWFELHFEDTSEADLNRFREQYRLMCSVCDLLDEGPLDKSIDQSASPEDKERLSKFAGLLEELHSKGAPPTSLHELIPKAM